MLEMKDDDGWYLNKTLLKEEPTLGLRKVVFYSETNEAQNVWGDVWGYLVLVAVCRDLHPATSRVPTTLSLFRDYIFAVRPPPPKI